tara:strand:+ start:763 stop:2034 length:1272 start_codon:yes stop_codon:yes gene_type:complete
MAIVLYSQPDKYQLAYNDNVYVWRVIPTTPTMRFRVLVYDSNLNALATLVVYPIAAPNQSSTPDRAYVDVSRIVQSAIGHDIEIAPASHEAYYINSQSHLEYSLIIKEEDIDPITGAYVTSPNWGLLSEKSVWNGVQDLADWVDFDSSDYLMTTGTGTTKFLTDGPTTREIKSDQSAYLYLIASEDNAPQKYEIKAYDGFDATGTQLAGATVTNPYALTHSASFKTRYLRLPIGTYDIPRTDATRYSAGHPLTILNGAKSYTIRLQSSHANISEVITFNIDQDCSKYEGVRLHWLGRLGGFESFNFNLKNIDRTDIVRKKYRQQHHTWTGTGWIYDKMSRGRTEYDIQTSKKIKVNTGYLSDSESVWMESLFSSPTIYEERSNELIAINIDGRSIIKQTSLNDKLCQYSFNLEYSLLNNRQRG